MKHQSRIRRALLGSASAAVLSTLAFTTSAVAQEQTPDDATVIDEVIVTARRQAIQAATELKRNSDTMIDSVVAEDAGKLPDNSITEVLQRVSGVTMVRFAALGDPDHFSVEGSGIQVRGLSGITGLLNGREVFGANGGGGLSWAEVTPELMAGVDVYKANRADMIEGGLGGAIDLRTKMPFDYREGAVEGSLGVSYGDMVEEASPSGSILLTDRWDTSVGEVGLLVDLAYSDFYSQASFLRAEPYYRRTVEGEDRYIPGGFTYGDEHFRRTRQGIYQAFQWRPNDTLTVFQTFFQSEYASNNDESGVFVANNDLLLPDPTTSSEFDENGFLIRADRIYRASENTPADNVGGAWGGPNCQTPYGTQAQQIDWGTGACALQRIGVGSTRGIVSGENMTRDFSQGFTWDVTDRLRVAGTLQFVESSVRSRMFGMGLGNSVNSISMDFTGDLPVFAVEDNGYLSNTASYTWDSIRYREVRNRANMGAATLDVDYDLGDGFFTEISAGVRYADRSERDTFDGTYWAPTGRGWNASRQRTLADGSPEDSSLYMFENFFSGDATLPATFYLPTTDLLSSFDTVYAQTTYGYTDEDNGAPVNPTVFTDPFGTSDTDVTTSAVYIQGRFGSDTGLFGVPFTGNIGVRVVETETTSRGFFQYSESDFYLTQAEADADLLATGGNNPNHLSATGFERSGGLNYTKVLPSFNINFKPTEELYFRMAVNRTMSPAGYNDIRATGSAGINRDDNANNVPGPGGVNYAGIFRSVSGNTGNPSLKPTMSTNFDATAEWYPSRSTTAHLSLFHKDIDDLIIYGDTVKPITINYTNGAGQAATLDTTISSSEVFNSPEKSTINGFEVGLRTFFDNLPGAWKGFGVEANYTYIDSDNPGAKALDVNGQVITTPLPIVGLSRDTYNVVLMYEYNKLSARLAYNWRSRYLQSTNSNGTNGEYLNYASSVQNTSSNLVDISLPVYGEEYGSLDFGINYELPNRVKIWFQAANVNNEIAKTVMGGYPDGVTPIRSWFQSDRRYSAGLNFRF